MRGLEEIPLGAKSRFEMLRLTMHRLPKDLIVTLIVEDPERIELIRILNLLDVTRVSDEVPR